MQNLLDHVNGFLHRLWLANLAKDKMERAQEKMKMLLHRYTEWLVFSLGGGVLAVLPITVRN